MFLYIEPSENKDVTILAAYVYSLWFFGVSIIPDFEFICYRLFSDTYFHMSTKQQKKKKWHVIKTMKYSVCRVTKQHSGITRIPASAI